MEQTIAQGWVQEGIELGRELGRIETLRMFINEFGEKRFGNPNTAIQTALQSFADVGRLERLLRRVSDVSSWDELLKEYAETNISKNGIHRGQGKG